MVRRRIGRQEPSCNGPIHRHPYRDHSTRHAWCAQWVTSSVHPRGHSECGDTLPISTVKISLHTGQIPSRLLRTPPLSVLSSRRMGKLVDDDFQNVAAGRDLLASV